MIGHNIIIENSYVFIYRTMYKYRVTYCIIASVCRLEIRLRNDHRRTI